MGSYRADGTAWRGEIRKGDTLLCLEGMGGAHPIQVKDVKMDPPRAQSKNAISVYFDCSARLDRKTTALVSPEFKARFVERAKVEFQSLTTGKKVGTLYSLNGCLGPCRVEGDEVISTVNLERSTPGQKPSGVLAVPGAPFYILHNRMGGPGNEGPTISYGRWL